MLRWSKCKKTAQIVEKCQKLGNFEAKTCRMLQNFEKKLQNSCLKCSPNYAEQSPPRFGLVKSMLMWSKCKKTAQIVEKC